MDACVDRPSWRLIWLYPDADVGMLDGIDAELPITLAESVGRIVLVVLLSCTTLALAEADPSSASRRAMIVWKYALASVAGAVAALAAGDDVWAVLIPRALVLALGPLLISICILDVAREGTLVRNFGSGCVITTN